MTLNLMPMGRKSRPVLTYDAATGLIAAGRFVLRRVQISDAGLFALYAGDRRVAEATRSI